jgi:hypothetical protein
MTRPTTTRRSNYRITRRIAVVHKAHATAPHLGCVLCVIGVLPPR